MKTWSLVIIVCKWSGVFSPSSLAIISYIFIELVCERINWGLEINLDKTQRLASHKRESG